MTGVRTSAIPTWCPGCFNFQILAGVQSFLDKQLKSGKKKQDFGIVAGIGCHAKIFDYLDMPGINTLHGRVLPTCIGMKLANPKLNILGFSGDGDAYSEGIEHLIHAARYNPDIKYVVHDNQVFALTLGEPTPTTEQGFVDKTNPSGVQVPPINPIKIMLGSGATFVARIFANTSQVQEILTEAFAHKGFAFIEILQPCLVFHSDKGYDSRFYNLQKSNHNKLDISAALAKADEFDYNSKSSKIPLGIFYQEKRKTFEELKSKKVMKSKALEELWQK